MKPNRTLLTTIASTLLLFLGSCASQKTLAQYQDEVRTLREERTQLKKENRDLRAQNEAYEVQMAEAAMKPAETAPISENPELDALGVDYGRDKYGNQYFSVSSDVTFASGKAELTSKGKEALKAVANNLKGQDQGARFWIEGHTDTDPIKKSSWESNRDLSVARAMAVLHYLVEDCDVSDDQCVVAGHGQYDPINDDKARNRRVEIVVHQ